MRRVILLSTLAFAAVGCPDNNTANNDMAVSTDDMASSDGGGCGAEGAACDASGKNGLCKSGACVACADPADDAACQSAYGSTTEKFICETGACVTGCRDNTACGAKICGLSMPRRCAGCTTDTQCQMMVNNTTICEISTGNCVTSACATAGAACAANPADICCASGGGNACFPGSCCLNSECGDAGKGCVNHVCTTCPAPSGNTVFVDPSETPGGAPTGADMPGCRFPTITAAILSLGSPSVAKTVHVLGTKDITGSAATCTAKTGECFPIAVPSNVTVTGDSIMRPNIIVPATQTGFTLNGASSAVRDLTLDGWNGATRAAYIGFNAVATPTPSPTPLPVIQGVTARRFGVSGATVTGQLSIFDGTQLTDNELGLSIEGGLTIVQTIGSTPVQINKNGDGIGVTGGSLTMIGTPGTGGAGTVQVNENTLGGIYAQFSGSGFYNLTGVAIWKNGNDGVRTYAGTKMTVRGCYIMQNGGSGIDIDADSGKSVTTVNLGTNKDGLNTLQSSGSDKNVKAGICLHTPASDGTLSAQGNLFAGRNCSMNTPGNVNYETTCAAGVDIASTNASAGLIDVANCGQM